MLQAVKANSWYRHFKETTYYVYGVAEHTETEQLFVLYENTGEGSELWCRPLENFCSLVEVEGQMVPRFTFLREFGAESTPSANT